MAKLELGYSESTGQHFVRLPGNQVQQITPEQAETIRSDPGAVSNFLQSAAGAGKELLLGAATFGPDADLARQQLMPVQQERQARSMGSPISTGVGAAVPAVAAGLATMGAGVLPTIGVEAALGAAASPDEPFVGAALGGALGAVPFAAQGARAGVQAAGRMSERVLGRYRQVDEASTPGAGAPYLQGLATTDELAGVPLTAGDRAALSATTKEQFAKAQTARSMEEFRRADPLFGGGINNAREQQKAAISTYIKKQLDIPDNVALTDDVLADTFTRLGSNFDQYATGLGKVPVADSIKAIDEIAEQATGTHAGQLKKIVDDIKRLSPDGSISGQDWQVMRTRISKMIDAGQRQGDYAKLSDAQELMRVMQDTLEGNMEQWEREALRANRKQYRLAVALSKSGSRDVAGEINPRSALSYWKQGQSKKTAGTDDIGRMLNTAAFLTTRITPSSGTAERLLANPMRPALTVGAGALGGVGLNQLLQ